MSEIVKDKIAFEQETGGYVFRATYLTEPKGDSLIEIEKGGQLVKSFLWPSYKIWNIAAHAQDIADGLDEESDAGLKQAGWTALGGNVYNSEAA